VTVWLGSPAAYGAVLAHDGGHDLPPLTPEIFFTRADPFSPAVLFVLVAGGGYLWGVARLRRRGDTWSTGRTAVFLLGLALVALVTASGLEAYDTSLLSVHMVQHMVMSMVSPIFLALGAPITLALRTLPARARGVLLRVLHSRVARFYAFPLVSFGLFVASPFVLYFSDLYRLSLQSSVVHTLVHVHLVAVGCLFFWPLIGLDPVPGRTPYPMRALLMFLSTPFHTVLGLTIMQSSSLLGGDWYPSLDLAWSDPAADQRLAGGILWAGGEFVAVAMLGALVVQWMRHSEREARRIDRALDRAEAAGGIGPGSARPPEPGPAHPGLRPAPGGSVASAAAPFDAAAESNR
jgi:putative copper resistance protein D